MSASHTGAHHASTVDELASRYPRVAVSHEWLTIPGGSENVLMAILALLPHAELFTSVYAPQSWPAQITGRAVHTSFLNRVPGAARHYPKLLPLMDAAFRSFKLDEFDLVVSSNHACAKNVHTPAGAVHVCYCHTPMRYAWDPDFLAGERLGVAGRLAFRALLPRLRRTDLRGAGQPDTFVANSTVVAARIARFYGRDAEVVHPPVDVERFLGVRRSPTLDAPYLVFGRVVPYKRVEQAVMACERLGRPLIVAGTGRDLARVRGLGGAQTTFIGRVPDTDLSRLLAGCRALLFPGEEDFGIVPVEAQAAGLPVIGNRRGGVRDSVIDGTTGVLYEPPTVAGLCAAIERFEALELDEGALRDNARRFSPSRFQEAFARVLLEQSVDVAADRPNRGSQEDPPAR